MTREERTVFLRDQLHQARVDALEASSVFDGLIAAHDQNAKELDKAAQAVILAAAEVRIAARAVLLDTPRVRRVA